MEIIVKDSINLINHNATRVQKYKMWKQPLHKWDQYVFNKNKKIKYIDEWSNKILNDLSGNTLAYNCGGLFFKDFNKDIDVLEYNTCPINIQGMYYLTNLDFNFFKQKYSNLITINPISLKYNTSFVNFLFTSYLSRAGFKPVIVDWLKENYTIYMSFSDYHIYYNRLKFSLEEMIDIQIKELNSYNISCIFKEVTHSTDDLVNGNIKLILKGKKHG
jgi:hypothetical protein